MPKIINGEKMNLVGLFDKTDSQEKLSQKCPEIWGKFGMRMGEIDMKENNPCYGGTIMHGENEIEYFATVSLENGSKIPKGMNNHVFEEVQYAVFTHKGTLSKLGETYNFIYSEWLPKSDYVLAGNYDLEKYDERYNMENPDHPESAMDIMIPIKNK